MKPDFRRRMAFLAVAALAFLPLSARADITTVPVMVHFSGGDGEKLTVTFPEAVDFSVLVGDDQLNIFVLQEAGAGSLLSDSATGTAGFQIVGGPMVGFNYMETLILDGDIGLHDLVFLVDSYPTVQAGDTVTLLAGSLTYDMADQSHAPEDGIYNAFFTDENGIDITGPVPEPSTCALLATGAIALLFAGLRRILTSGV